MPPPDENAVLEPPESLATDSIADPSDKTLGKPSGVVSTSLSLTKNTDTYLKTLPDADPIIMTRELGHASYRYHHGDFEPLLVRRFGSPSPNQETDRPPE